MKTRQIYIILQRPKIPSGVEKVFRYNTKKEKEKKRKYNGPDGNKRSCTVGVLSKASSFFVYI